MDKVQTTMRLPEDLLADLKQYAAVMGISVNAAVITLLRSALEG